MNSNAVFRFVSMRGVQKAASEEMSVLRYRFGLSPLTQLAAKIHQKATQEHIIQLCTEFKDSDSYLANPPEIAGFEGIIGQATIDEAKAKFAETFEVFVEEHVATEEFRSHYDKIWDSFYTATVLGGESLGDVRAIARAVRQSEYLLYIANIADDKLNISLGDLEQARLAMPVYFTGNEAKVDSELTAEYSEVVKKSTEMLEAASSRISRDLRSIEVLKGLDERYRFSESSEPEETKIEGGEDTGGQVSVSIDWPEPWLANEEIVKSLPANVLATINDARVPPSELPVPEYISSIDEHTTDYAASVLGEIPAYVAEEVLDSDDFAVVATAAGPAAFNARFAERLSQVVAEEVPNGVRSLGIGDLILVRERLKKYELGEIAHIQNILQSESLKRTHSRLKEIEETITIETETTEDESHSLQSTERFEMQREVQKSIEERDEQSAGVSITASYGPVSMTARTEISSSKAQSESSKSAKQYAKEVTEESVKRVSNRVREERVRRTLQRFEETNEHGFDNSDGNTNITGVYRWVNKVYRNYLVNYGRRLLLEFIVPEPAAFFWEASKSQSRPGITVQKPPEPTYRGSRLVASNLTKRNYQYYASLYGLSDIEPYPEDGIRTGTALIAGIDDNTNGNFPYAASNSDFEVPSGYVARGYTASWSWSGVGNNFWATWKVAGRNADSMNLSGLTGKLPMSVVGWGSKAQMNLTLTAYPTSAAIRAWQDKVFASIMEAYEQRLAIYNEEVSALSVEEGIQFGRRPDENRLIETSELRKGAIRLLTNDFDRIKIGNTVRLNEKFDAMEDDLGSGFPEFEIDEAAVEGKISQFFEQAFEWQNMTYGFYPYFWGRKERWIDIQGRYDADPKFTEFLRSGAARVVVPVHPAYQDAILHYFATKEIWLGDEPPVLEDELYISIVEDLKNGTEYNPPEDLPLCTEGGSTPCVLETWEVTLPSSLVYLQDDAALPEFELPVVENDIEAILDAKVEELGLDLNWRSSVVDLLKTLEQPSDLGFRRNLARKLGYPGGGDTSSMNIWLHAKIIQVLIDNGGVWPDSLSD